MKIGIIGSGEMGSHLGTLWARAGHEVFFSSRHPQKLASLAQEAGPRAYFGKVADAAAFGQVILFSPNFSSMAQALQEAGSLQGKVLIDITNPVSWDEKNDRLIRILPEGATAVSEVIKRARGAKIVKAFSHLPSAHLIQNASRSPENRLTVFYCGNNPESKKVVAQLIEDSGFVPLDLGGLDHAQEMEIPGPLAFKALPLDEAQQLVRKVNEGNAA